MKKIFNCTLLIAVSIIAGFSTLSCSSDKESSDVTEFVSLMDKMSDAIGDAQNVIDLQTISDEYQKSFDEFEKSETQLTDADYSAISKAMYNLTVATFKLMGQELPAYSGDYEEKATEQLRKYKTLGELAKAINNNQLK